MAVAYKAACVSLRITATSSSPTGAGMSWALSRSESARFSPMVKSTLCGIVTYPPTTSRTARASTGAGTGSPTMAFSMLAAERLLKRTRPSRPITSTASAMLSNISFMDGFKRKLLVVDASKTRPDRPPAKSGRHLTTPSPRGHISARADIWFTVVQAGTLGLTPRRPCVEQRVKQGPLRFTASQARP